MNHEKEDIYSILALVIALPIALAAIIGLSIGAVMLGAWLAL